MGDSETGQVSEDAARIYEQVYLPALFQQWCPEVIGAAKVKAGDSVVDVACGTGALAIAVADQVGANGKTTGVDINRGMLDIARSKSSAVEWINAPAEELPFTDDFFDSAVSQFGLMYFENQETAVREMRRVVRPGGSIALAVWDSLDNNPGLAAEEYLWHRVFGDVVDETPYRLGDKDFLANLLGVSGISHFEILTHGGTARFDSIKQWIHAGARGWTEDDALTDDELIRLLDAAEKELTEFMTKEDTVVFPTFAHIVTARV